MNSTAILRLLDEQLAQLTQLGELLILEREKIISREVELLEEAIQNKIVLLDQIQTKDQALAPHLSDIIIEGEIKDKISDVQAKMQHCQEENEVNGIMIEENQKMMNRLQSMLLEAQGRTRGMTYDKAGKARVNPSNKGVKA